VLFFLVILGTDLTATDAGSEISSLEGFTLRPVELSLFFNSGQPEAQFVSKVVARSTSSIALDEWGSPEIFQARARAGQRLAAAFSSSCRVLLRISEGQIFIRN